MNPIIIAERVRYAETDQMGVAYHGCYPAWFEIGRTAYCRQKGVVYAELEKQGWALVVVELKAEYKKPLRYDDPFEIHTTVSQASPRALTFEYRIVRDGVVCTEGMTRHMFVAMDTFKPASAPAEVVRKLTG